MTRIERSAYVPFSAEQMFDLVNDVKAYPLFLPGCNSASVISQTEEEIVASLEVSKGPVKQSFTTRNVLVGAERIEMNLVKGPFKKLHGVWHFSDLSEGNCKISLTIDFELSGMLKFAFGGVFSQVAGSMVDSFSKRAKVVYGE
ncbi:type II toxin-antitoxin system RatA family toxin [Marinomonas sp. PE14-40]|uniref:type II toxin-antitoxin system RatA family toxin n=1 Tax=Marinomonas sp. PE14-40 TaxID=3060621 RepID=UPI003F67AC50